MLTTVRNGRPLRPASVDPWGLDSMWRLFDDLGFGSSWRAPVTETMPRMNLVDAGSELRLYAELPGFGADDVEVTVERNRLTLRGQRKREVPEGYSVRRSERGDLAFTRTLTLPCRVDADAIDAQLASGILTLTMPKAAEERPRQITVKAS